MAHDLALTRRQILQRASLAVATAVCPSVTEATVEGAVPQRETVAPPARAAAIEHPISDVMTRLSTYMSQARDRALPERRARAGEVARARHHRRDGLGIGAGAGPRGDHVRARLRRQGSGDGRRRHDPVRSDRGGAGERHVGARRRDRRLAGRAGGIRAATSCPRRWRSAEQFGTSGAHFLRAVVLGYDIGTRILITMRPGLANSHKATYAIAGVFGAAAAAGCAASLDAQQMRWVLDYTAQQSSGIASWFRDTDHIEKGFIFGGMPARSGVTSALLVHAGWNGVDDIMSGPDNFLLANAPTGQRRTAGRTSSASATKSTRTNIKRWTVGTPIQAPLDAMEALLKRQPIDPNQVQADPRPLGARDRSSTTASRRTSTSSTRWR